MKQVEAFYKLQRRGDCCWLSSAHTAFILSSLILSLLVGTILVFLRIAVPFPASLFLFFSSTEELHKGQQNKEDLYPPPRVREDKTDVQCCTGAGFFPTVLTNFFPTPYSVKPCW